LRGAADSAYSPESNALCRELPADSARWWIMNERIAIDPRICHGKPIIRGTRVPVARVIGYLAGGMTIEDVQKDFDLAPEDVRAALEYAADLLNQERHDSLPV
jgi:uncharacterized protein (DUF433 family)